MPEPIFHIAIAVDDLKKAREFYMGTLGCTERADTVGRGQAVINFFGAQLVAIEAPDQVEKSNDQEGYEPYKHFGIIMDWDEWHALVDRLKAKGVAFRTEPKIRDHKTIGEVGNLFLADPSGNYVEFKSYRNRARVLA